MVPIEKSRPSDAAEWDARLRSPDCTAAERAAFERWCLKNPENQRAFDRLQGLLGGLRSASDVPEIRSLREAALEAAGPTRWQRRRKAGLAVAACAAVLVAATLGWLAVVNQMPLGPGPAEPASFATAIGERSTANLDDGTMVVLNTNTRIQVAYSSHERQVTLLQGQALFEVAGDPTRRFVVVAGEQRITALGTVFDVRLEADDVEVTLVEGVVEIVAKKPIGSNLTGPAIAAKPVRLAAGQKLTTKAIAARDAPRIESTDAERATIWRQGRVFFEDVPLSEAVAEMNRYSTTQLVVTDEVLDTYRVNGMFRTGQQGNFVDALEAYFPLEIEREADHRILLKAK